MHTCGNCGRMIPDTKYCKFCGASQHKRELTYQNTNTLLRTNVNLNDIEQNRKHDEAHARTYDRKPADDVYVPVPLNDDMFNGNSEKANQGYASLDEVTAPLSEISAKPEVAESKASSSVIDAIALNRDQVKEEAVKTEESGDKIQTKSPLGEFNPVSDLMSEESAAEEIRAEEISIEKSITEFDDAAEPLHVEDKQAEEALIEDPEPEVSDETPIEDVRADEISVAESQIEEVPIEDISVEKNNLTDETPEDVRIEEISVEEIPIEEIATSLDSKIQSSEISEADTYEEKTDIEAVSIEEAVISKLVLDESFEDAATLESTEDKPIEEYSREAKDDEIVFAEDGDISLDISFDDLAEPMDDIPSDKSSSETYEPVEEISDKQKRNAIEVDSHDDETQISEHTVEEIKEEFSFSEAQSENIMAEGTQVSCVSDKTPETVDRAFKEGMPEIPENNISIAGAQTVEIQPETLDTNIKPEEVIHQVSQNIEKSFCDTVHDSSAYREIDPMFGPPPEMNYTLISQGENITAKHISSQDESKKSKKERRKKHKK